MMALGTCTCANYGHVKQITFKYEWTICDFTKCCENSDEYITSPPFYYGSNDEFKWQLILYPKGSEVSKKGSISLYLRSMNEFKLKSTSVLSILLNSFTLNDKLYLPHYKWGFPDFFTKEDNLVYQVKSFNDTLTIFCEICNVTTVDSLDTQNKNTIFKMLKDMSKLFEEKNCCDITIIVDRKKFPAHKAILAARSEVFAAMFKNDFVEKQNSMVEINDTEHQIFEELLRFIYTSEVKNLEMTAKDLLILADKYAVLELKSLCVDELCKSINLNNVVNLLLYADSYNVKLLKNRVIDIIIEYMKNPTSLAEFHLLETRPHLLTELFFKLASLHYK